MFFARLQRNKFNVAIPTAPSFWSFVPHSLHSGASGIPRKSNSPSFREITLNRVAPLIQSLHLPLHAPTRFSNHVYKSSSFSLYYLESGLSVRCEFKDFIVSMK